MRCPHCGKTILMTNEADVAGGDYDERNPPPPDLSSAPPDFFDKHSKSAAAYTPNNNIDKKYHEIEVYIEAESDKAFLCSDAAPGEESTFADWFPKSQLKDEGGNELGGAYLDWKKSYRRIQFSEWILKKKEVPGF